MKLLPIFYLPPITWFSEFLAENTEITLEKFEHFQKQTYRNRALIYGANGKLSLIIPINHNGQRKVKDIEISNRENWRLQHWKSIKFAYQSSPYFEFYEDKLEKIFEFRTDNLVEFNLNALEIILKILKTEKKYNFSQEYLQSLELMDFRQKFVAKENSEQNLQTYYQTFSDKYGFLEDLSILDLLCNIGPEALSYLKNLKQIII